MLFVFLKVMTLTPSNITCFPEYDWLIGNHSDELTPWIPVMAARYNCVFDDIDLHCVPTDHHIIRDTSLYLAAVLILTKRYNLRYQYP